MWPSHLWILLLVVILFSFSHPFAIGEARRSVKTSIFLSPLFNLGPGSVENNYYFDVPFPRGHIALKSFNGEVVDENQNPVPLHETYLHHWAIFRYYGEKGAIDDVDMSKFMLVKNSGICPNVGQYFGIGSETRKTNTWVPDPYGIQVGNPAEIPKGYEERWMLNLHAIDTRGVEDRLGCIECKCNLYNVTVDEHQQPLVKGYVGGLHCCYDQTHCRLRRGFNDKVKKHYLRYTVKWFEWNPSIIPLKIYILDVTYTRDLPSSSSSSVDAPLDCKVEYTVPQCDSKGEETNGNCVDIRKTNVVLPHGGDIIYGVAHQHIGGLGSALYGEDGRLLCSSIPIYGEGEGPGDEDGYIVGMSTCYPKSGTISIKDGESVSMVSNYSNVQMHAGVMGLFHIFVAEPQPKKLNTLLFLQGLTAPWFAEIVESWWVLLLAVGSMAVVAVAIFLKRNDTVGYQTVKN